MFVETKRKQFWQLSGKICAECQKQYCSKSDFAPKSKNWKNPHLQKVFWTRTKQFGQPLCKSFSESQKITCSGSWKNEEGFFKKFYLSKCSPEVIESSFDNFATKNLSSVKNNCFDQSQKDWRIFLSRIVFHQSVRLKV